MRKQTKIAAVASAAALLAIGASMTSFAATGVWDQDPDTGDWTYYNNLTDKEVIPGFHLDPKLNDGKYYFVDEVEEVMLTSQPVTWNDKLYFVDSSGAKVFKCWKSVDNDGEDMVVFDDENETVPDELYYYIDKRGYVEAAADGYDLIKVPVKTGSTKEALFMFSDEGYMETGWFKYGEGDWVYCAPEADEESGRVAGQAVTGWLDLTLVEDLPEELQGYVDDYEYSDPDDNGHVWMWFNDKGHSVHGTIPDAISGVKYSFNKDGLLNQKGWVSSTGERMPSTSGTSDDAYVYYARSTGELASGWYPMDKTWYYFVSNKAVGRDEADDITVRYISGKGYVFGEDGKLIINSYVGIGLGENGEVAGAVVNSKVDDDNPGGDVSVATASNSKRSDAYAKRFANKGAQYLNSDGEMATGTQFSYKVDDSLTVYGFVDANGNIIDDDVAIVDGKYVYAVDDEYREKYGIWFSVLKTPTYGDYTSVDLWCKTECQKDEKGAYKKDEKDNYIAGTKVIDEIKIVSYTKKGTKANAEKYYLEQVEKAAVNHLEEDYEYNWHRDENGAEVCDKATVHNRSIQIVVDGDGAIVKGSKQPIEIEHKRVEWNEKGEIVTVNYDYESDGFTVNSKGVVVYED